MSPSVSYFWNELLQPTLNAFALTVSLIGFVIGLGLLLATPATLAFFRRMNRRVSMRQATRSLEVPRNVEGAPGARHPVLGVVFILGGAYAAAVLLAQFDTVRTVEALHIAQGAAGAQVIFEAARWFLIVGGVAAVVLGALLLFRPQAWAAVEARANHWHSTRQMLRGGETMHEGLDRLVEAYPRTTGGLLVVASIVASGAFALLLFR